MSTSSPISTHREELQEDFRIEVREANRQMSEQLALLVAAFGHPSDDGKGGSGLTGEVRRLTTEVGGLLDLKRQGIGFVAAIALFGALILLGIKGWIGAAVAAFK